MELKELTERMQALVTAKGWYQPDSPREQNMRNMAISLCLECNEVLEHFQWSEQPADRHALALELADVALYLAQLANLAGIDLDAAIEEKLTINHDRQWPG